MQTETNQDRIADLYPVRVGCAGWSIPKLAAPQFPAGSDHLNRYSQLFNCCEINSSFYRSPRIATWQRWADSVPDDFRFAVKVPRTITHQARFVCSPELWLEFLNQIRHLDNKLGPILVQLPPSHVFESVQVAVGFSLLRQLHSGDIVCEPRHSSWFTEQASRTLQDFEIARVASDPACVPMASRPGGASTISYFRLHGSPRTYYSSYTDEFLSRISVQVKELARRAKVWCVFDNTALGAATINAIELKTKVLHDDPQ
jgi:uncharacterized protein YecE (DUF72 family)